MPLWTRFVLAIIIVVVLSVLFPVGGFRAILSLLIIFGIFEGLARLFPKYGHWLVVLLAAMLIINFGVVRIISDRFKKNMPLTSEALERRQTDTDRRTAEQVNPPGLRAKRFLYLYGKEVDDIEGAKLQQELSALKAKRQERTFTDDDAKKEQEIKAKIEALEKWYRELTPNSDKNLEQKKLNKLVPTIFVWVLGAIGLGILILGGVLKNKTLNGVGGLLIFLAIGLWAHQAFWPSVSGAVASSRSRASAAIPASAKEVVVGLGEEKEVFRTEPNAIYNVWSSAKWDATANNLDGSNPLDFRMPAGLYGWRGSEVGRAIWTKNNASSTLKIKYWRVK